MAQAPASQIAGAALGENAGFAAIESQPPLKTLRPTQKADLRRILSCIAGGEIIATYLTKLHLSANTPQMRASNCGAHNFWCAHTLKVPSLLCST